ncbi:hypothetical protein BT69DRAFT_1211126, partial [Atractiella rhizophila]
NRIWSAAGYYHFSSHSFHIVDASFLLQLGFDIEYIRMVGRWKTIMYERYLLDDYTPNLFTKITLLSNRKAFLPTISVSKPPHNFSDFEQSFLERFAYENFNRICRLSNDNSSTSKIPSNTGKEHHDNAEKKSARHFSFVAGQKC